LLPVVFSNAVESAFYLLLIGVLLWRVGSRIDRRPIADYGFHLSRAWSLDLCCGLALGALLLVGALALELSMGWIRVTGTFASPPGQAFVAAIVADFLLLIFLVVQEETTFRGYVVKNLAEGFNWKVIGPRWATVVAVLIPSLLFGLGHFDNPNATTLSTLNTVLSAVLFGTAYVLTGELALPLGLHFAWDFTQAFVFGVTNESSNLGSFLVLAEDDPTGKPWTGFPYGIEGGLLGTGALVVGFALMMGWVRLRQGSVHLHTGLAHVPAAHEH
jgi:uncharacterized protein